MASKLPNFSFRRAETLDDRGADPRHEIRQFGIADRRPIDLNAFVEPMEMRRDEQAGAQAEGVADTGAERRGTSLAV